MNPLTIPYIQQLDRTSAIEDIAGTLDKLEKIKIEAMSWPAYNYKPEVMFTIAHSHKCLFLKFYVSEHNIRAKYRNTNDPVYKDSCVEFFISFNGAGEYYNFEFNCLGTCRAGFGKDRNNRKELNKEIISRIKSLSVVKPGRNGQPDIHWQLTLLMPIEVFSENELSQFEGLKSKANFFKCGDDLPKPHFLSWSPIKAESPNFHLPEFFGEIQFI